MPIEAITPVAVKQANSKEFEERVDKIITTVNKQLKTYVPGSPVAIPFLSLGGEDERSHVLDTYEKAGWFIGKEIIPQGENGKVHYMFADPSDLSFQPGDEDGVGETGE